MSTPAPPEMNDQTKSSTIDYMAPRKKTCEHLLFQNKLYDHFDGGLQLTKV